MKHRSRRKSADVEAFSRQLHNHSMKATPRRIAVHEAMMNLVHASADQVLESVLKAGKVKITRGTVYTILSELADKGIYARRYSSTGTMFFDVNPWRHVHLYDTRNHDFVDLDEEEILKGVEDRLRGRRFKGYKIDDIDIQIICHPTRKKLL